MDEGIYYDEFLSVNIQEGLEELRDEDLPQAMSDAGEVGELALIEAQNRGWTVERKIVSDANSTTVSVRVLSKGDDEEEV